MPPVGVVRKSGGSLDGDNTYILPKTRRKEEEPLKLPPRKGVTPVRDSKGNLDPEKTELDNSPKSSSSEYAKILVASLAIGVILGLAIYYSAPCLLMTLAI